MGLFETAVLLLAVIPPICKVIGGIFHGLAWCLGWRPQKR